MKAAYYDKYGPPEVFQVVDLPKPKPRHDEILVRNICSTVNRTDTGMTSAIYVVSRLFTGLFSPKRKVPGTDFAGIVESVGSGVTHYKTGDRVFGFNDNILSSQAEYLVVKEDGNVAQIPDNTDFVHAVASLEGAHYAINMLNKIDVKKGDDVLVNGATGAIGSAVVQLLKNKGVKVTTTANTHNISRIKELGADRVIDYLKEDFTEKKGAQYNFILDTVGKSSFKKCKPLLKKGGVYISSELGNNGANIWLSLIGNFHSGRRVKFPIPSKISESLQIMKGLLESNQFRPLIDRKFSLDEVVEAYTYVTAGEKTGNVILWIQEP